MLQQIYDFFRAAGMTRAGALGMIGNLKEESGLEACRLQGDFSGDRAKSRDYASRVDRGQLSRHQFSYDAQGWGLPQWTYFTRKGAFWDFCKKAGASIADVDAQLRYIVHELKIYYPELWKALRSTTDVYTATRRVCAEYERPAVQNVTARYNAAMAAGSAVSDGAERFWPPRTIDKGMTGPDVAALRGVLAARGYDVEPGLTFDAATEAAVEKFQAGAGLAADKVVGPLTWAALLKI